MSIPRMLRHLCSANDQDVNSASIMPSGDLLENVIRALLAQIQNLPDKFEVGTQAICHVHEHHLAP
jgi:hypothetical protein